MDPTRPLCFNEAAGIPRGRLSAGLMEELTRLGLQ